MDKLTKKEFWESQYKERLSKKGRHVHKSLLKSLFRTLVGSKAIEYAECYEDYLLWDVIYEKYFPKIKATKLLEVGSAPGNNLLKFHQRFGFIPYGVEYSVSGVELNRKVFISNGIDPDNVIHADFFSHDFQEEYKGYFNFVVSNGFIEHFSNVHEVVEKHINLLSDGGYLIINIPNFKGLSNILKRLFDRESLSIHNLNIMEREEFSKLFNKDPLFPLFCDYSGTFNLTLPSSIAEGHSNMSRAIKIMHLAVMNILNVSLRLSFKDTGAENKFFSTNLTYIGLKNKHCN
ncbi:class I SAM-dependent methyltransferase [Thermodesulfobacteriota bacterium]